MLANLWKSYFENDVESFRQSLAHATFGASTPSKGGHGGKGGYVGTTGSPGSALAPSPTHQSKNKKPSGSSFSGLPALSASSKSTAVLNARRADLNGRDSNGVTLLHSIASSTNETASQFAVALLQAPLLDLYVQDVESGWTALHRALYFGNVTIARALMSRDTHDASDHINTSAVHFISSLIKIKDREGNSPFDVYGASIASRSIRQGSSIPLLSGPLEEEETDTARGVSGDENSDHTRSQDTTPRAQINGDEVFTFGSNKNFTLGFGDEDDRQYPERVFLERPDYLLQRFYNEYRSQTSASDSVDLGISSRALGATRSLPVLIQYRPIVIQDVQLSKLHSAILTTDPEANLYICGFGPGGRIGTGDETTRFHFVCIHGGGLSNKRVIDVGLGQNHTIAISNRGEVFTWGSNSFGQLGYASPTSKLKDDEPVQLLPRQVFGPVKREIISGAAASRVHSVLYTANSLFTFGKNDGQLGLVDSDARSLVIQNTPRKVAAALFSSSIIMVSAIDKATICLLENHDVWIFANYGYTKMSFPLEGFFDPFGKNSYLAHHYNNTENHVCKITSGGDTICAMSSMGDVFTVNVSQKAYPDAVASSTTNPSKIRGALSNPQRVWSLKKGHMAVRDVAVGQDSSIIICTESGSVWRRIKRAKVKDVNAPGVAEYKPKDYKFSRVGGLTRIAAVRSSTFGAYAAVRRDCDVLKAQMEIDSKSLWKDLYPLLPFQGLGAEEDSDTEEPALRFWIPSQPANDPSTIRRVISSVSNLEERVATILDGSQAFQRSTYDLRIKSTTSDVVIPVNEFILSGRSEVMRRALAAFRQNYYFSIPEVMTIEYDGEGQALVSFPATDFITVLNLVLYIYTDTLADVWRHIKRSLESSIRYRQVRLELMKIASHLEMPGLEKATRIMIEPSKTLHQDIERAISQPSYFETGDVEIELKGKSIRVHSALMCQRCPFFEGLFNGRAAGLWLSSRRQELEEPQQAIKIDLTHVEPNVFEFVLRYLYADIDDDLFREVVTPDFDSFIDLVLDVMSVANELMLDRLQQCCQKSLGRFVNTRNVCQLLNAVAPCSVTEFKDAALEYVCLNLEGMLENHLLDELDDDLMLELDEVVRQNQLACLPISKSGIAEAELFKTYPELPSIIERERQAKLDAINLHSRSREEDIRYGSFSKGKSTQVDHSNLLPVSQISRPRSSKGRSGASKSPYLKARSSVADLMFEMDEGGDPDMNFLDITTPTGEIHVGPVPCDQALYPKPTTDNTDQFILGAERILTLEKNLDPENSVSPLPSSDPIQLSVYESTADKSTQPPSGSAKPWGSTTLDSHKLDMRDIMAQASSNRISTLSSGLSRQAQNAASTASSLPKISQRARKKQQQQQQQQQQKQPAPIVTPDANSPLELNSAHTRDEKSKSPWQITSPGPKVSLKDVLGADQVNSPTPKQGAAPSNSPLTLRQTVPGNISTARSPITRGERQQVSLPNRSPSVTQPLEEQPHPSRSFSVTQTPTTPSSSSNPTPHSIRHFSHPVEPSLQLSMADILSQQQTEKDIFRDVGAKRSLQEIQEEQAFQEWWDEESRKIRMEEEARGISVDDEAGRGGNGRGRGRSRARGRGRGYERGGMRGRGTERGGSRGRGGVEVPGERGGSRGGAAGNGE